MAGPLPIASASTGTALRQRRPLASPSKVSTCRHNMPGQSPRRRSEDQLASQRSEDQLASQRSTAEDEDHEATHHGTPVLPEPAGRCVRHREAVCSPRSSAGDVVMRCVIGRSLLRGRRCQSVVMTGRCDSQRGGAQIPQPLGVSSDPSRAEPPCTDRGVAAVSWPPSYRARRGGSAPAGGQGQGASRP
jgi:hypothetical protein